MFVGKTFSDEKTVVSVRIEENTETVFVKILVGRNLSQGIIAKRQKEKYIIKKYKFLCCIG